MQQQPSAALVRWQRSISFFLFPEDRSPGIAKQPCPSLRVPKVKPAVMHVQDELSPWPKDTKSVGDDPSSLLGSRDHAQCTEQTSGVVEGLIRNALELHQIGL